jgi:hypothetical protein
MKRSKWDQRMQRADELTAAHTFAAEMLQFYKQIARFQKELYSLVQGAQGNQSKKRVSGSLRETLICISCCPSSGSSFLLPRRSRLRKSASLRAI